MNLYYWLKKNWHYLLGSMAIIAAFTILLVYSPNEQKLWVNILQSVYNAFSLIILEGGNFSFPNHAPQTVQIILWICYFAAPLLTLTVIFRYIQERFLATRIPRRIKSHIIICGLGRNGKMIYDLVRTKERRAKIVIIENDLSNAYSEKLEKDPKTWWLKQDFSKEPVLLKAGIKKAAKVYITTNNDLANIQALMAAVEKSTPACGVNCHIGDIRLFTNIEKVVKKEPEFAKVKLFNGYKMATQSLFKNKVEPQVQNKNKGNIYLFFGFGRFGQMLYNYIVNKNLNPDTDQVIIVTLDQAMMLDNRNFTWSLNALKKIKPDKHFCDMHDVGLWDKLAESIPEDKKLVIFGCRDNDIANINLAVSLMNSGPDKLKKGTFYCRTYSETPEKLQQILLQDLTVDNSEDVVLFPLYKELKEAFRMKLFN